MISVAFALDDDAGEAIISLASDAVPRTGDVVRLPNDAGDGVRYEVVRVEWSAGRSGRSLSVNVFVKAAPGRSAG